MKDIFDMDKRDLNRLKDFMRESPREFRRSTAGVLNSLAFSTRRYDIDNINKGMTVRNPRFVSAMLRVEKTRATEITKQQSSVSSLRRGSFTGWEEQQTGKPARRDRAATTAARGGNIRNRVRPRFSMRSSNKFHRPSQFDTGRGSRSAFAFMMRVLATRGGGEFFLSQPQGRMTPGLYSFRKHKISRVQAVGNIKDPRRFKWRDESIRQLVTKNDIRKIWTKEIERVVSRAGR